MSLRDRLIAMLRDTFEVQHAGDADLAVTARGRVIPLRASEPDLAAFASAHTDDGLAALGEVGDDPTGTIAALALLSVHIEEAIEVSHDRPVARLRVGVDGLIVERTPPAH